MGKCSGLKYNMICPSRPALNKVILCIMKHPCIFGLCFAVGAIMVWWSFSGFAHASRQFHIRDMRMFPFGSNVREIYNGSLETLGRFLQQSELRFVVYYAPWCAQSRKMVPEMGLAADMLKESYVFIAINCWVGSCKLNFTLEEFPKFFAYHSTYPPVEFIEPPESTRIVSFLKSIARPLTYVGNENSLQELVSSNEAIIFGYFNIGKENNKRFSVFLNLCIKNSNKNSKILCGIVTSSRIAQLIGFRTYGQLILRQVLGKQWFFPSTLNFTSEMIFSWITKHHTEFAMKLSPTMLNLDHYITQLKRGPAVLLFVSQRPVNSRSSLRILHQFKYTAAVYNNCSQEVYSQDPSSPFSPPRIDEIPRKSEPCVSFVGQNEAKVCDVCQHTRVECIRENNPVENYVGIGEIPTRYGNTNSCSCLQNYRYSNCTFMTVCCVKVSKAIEENTTAILSSIFGDVERKDKLRKDELAEGLKALASFNETTITFKKALDSLIDSFELLLDVASKTDSDLTARKDRTRDLAKKILQPKVNSKSRESLTLLRGQFDLDRMHTSLRKAHHDSNRRQLGNFSSHDFIGLRCKTNRTVNFFYLDFDKHKTMIRELGISNSKFKASFNHPILAIVDVKNEATFVMKGKPPLSHNSMVNFITNFTNGRLERHLRTSNEYIEERKATYISELTSSTFEKIVLDNSKDVFLMYYAPWCGFCKPAQRVFLELARKLETITTLRFARINADINELPYHYTVAGFPSFILFPKDRKSHSQAYPEIEPIRVQDMMNFICKHSSIDTRTALTRLLKNII